MSIKVYSKSGCPQCVFTKKFLEAQDIPFEEKRVDKYKKYLEEVQLLGYRALPVVADNLGNTFSGYQPNMLEKLVTEWQK